MVPNVKCPELSSHLIARLISITPTGITTHLGMTLGAMYPFLRPLIEQVRNGEIDPTTLMPTWTLKQFIMQMLVSTYTVQSGFYTSGRLLSDIHTLFCHRDKITAITVMEPLAAIATLVATLYCQQFFSNDAFKSDGEALAVETILASEMGRTLGTRLGNMWNHWFAVDTKHRKDSTMEEIVSDCWKTGKGFANCTSAIFTKSTFLFQNMRDRFCHRNPLAESLLPSGPTK